MGRVVLRERGSEGEISICSEAEHFPCIFPRSRTTILGMTTIAGIDH